MAARSYRDLLREQDAVRNASVRPTLTGGPGRGAGTGIGGGAQTRADVERIQSDEADRQARIRTQLEQAQLEEETSQRSAKDEADLNVAWNKFKNTTWSTQAEKNAAWVTYVNEVRAVTGEEYIPASRRLNVPGSRGYDKLQEGMRTPDATITDVYGTAGDQSPDADADADASDQSQDTVDDIYRRWSRGGYGDRNSDKAIDDAVTALANLAGAQLGSQEYRDIISRFDEFRSRELPSDLPDPTDDLPGTTLKDEREYQRLKTATEGGRGELFRRFVSNRLGAMPAPTQAALLRQQNRYSDIYDIQQGLGDLPIGQNFSDFLAAQGGPLGRPDPSILVGLEGRLRDLLERGISPDTDKEDITRVQTYRDKLAGDIGRQQQIAERTGEQSIPLQLRDTFSRLGLRNLNEYELAQRLGKMENRSFLDFVNQAAPGASRRGVAGPPVMDMGQASAATNPNAARFRDYARDAAGLLSDPSTIGGNQLRKIFYERLRNDPSEQYNIAHQAARYGIPANMREGFDRMAQRAHLQWQGQHGTYANFLSAMANQASPWNFATISQTQY